MYRNTRNRPVRFRGNDDGIGSADWDHAVLKIFPSRSKGNAASAREIVFHPRDSRRADGNSSQRRRKGAAVGVGMRNIIPYSAIV